jgi:hypothetical protein
VVDSRYLRLFDNFLSWQGLLFSFFYDRDSFSAGRLSFLLGLEDTCSYDKDDKEASDNQ